MVQYVPDPSSDTIEREQLFSEVVSEHGFRTAYAVLQAATCVLLIVLQPCTRLQVLRVACWSWILLVLRLH
jgi:hypothetical protein